MILCRSPSYLFLGGVMILFQCPFPTYIVILLYLFCQLYFLLWRIFKIRFDAWNLKGFRQKKVWKPCLKKQLSTRKCWMNRYKKGKIQKIRNQNTIKVCLVTKEMKFYSISIVNSKILCECFVVTKVTFFGCDKIVLCASTFWEVKCHVSCLETKQIWHVRECLGDLKGLPWSIGCTEDFILVAV